MSSLNPEPVNGSKQPSHDFPNSPESSHNSRSPGLDIKIPLQESQPKDEDPNTIPRKSKAADDDDISIASPALKDFVGRDCWDPHTYTGDEIKGFKKDGGKYARVTGLYIEGLEARVSSLEREISGLRAQSGFQKNVQDTESVF